MTLTFGDLREATERVGREPSRVDVVVWCVLHAPDDVRDDWRVYAREKLRGMSVGRVELDTLLDFVLDAEPALQERLEFEQLLHIEKGSLTRRLVFERHVHAWFAALAWLVVTRRGHVSWAGSTVRNWMAVVDPTTSKWFGFGLDNGDELKTYIGEENDEPEAGKAPYVIRHCEVPDGEPWSPDALPAWPDDLEGRPPELDDDDEVF